MIIALIPDDARQAPLFSFASDNVCGANYLNRLRSSACQLRLCCSLLTLLYMSSIPKHKSSARPPSHGVNPTRMNNLLYSSLLHVGKLLYCTWVGHSCRFWAWVSRGLVQVWPPISFVVCVTFRRNSVSRCRAVRDSGTPHNS